MGQIRIKVVPRREPDIQLYVLALIALARQLQEQEEGRGQDTGPTAPSGEGAGGSRG